MPGKPVKIGPFSGGLNTYSATTAVEDNQVVDIVNFDVDLDGSLLSRPPIIVKGTTPASIRPLGYFKDANGSYYLIGSGGTTTYFYDGSTWATITATFAATAMVQYAGKAWLVAPAGSANPGGNWTFNVFTAVAAMKKGNTACVYKERMFIADGSISRIYLSTATDFTVWNTADFFDVSNGDGQNIIEIRVFNDTIVAFKINSTYIYSYDTSPGRGAVRSVSTSIGTADKDCVVEYEAGLYVLHNKGVYHVTNWNYDKLNTLVPFIYANTFSAVTAQAQCISVVNDRLIVRYFDRVYIFGLKARVWTTWQTVSYFNKFWAVPGVVTAVQEFVTTSARTDDNSTFSFLDTWNVTRTETMTCTFTTKSFQFDTPFGFKKLSWWGADVLAKAPLTGTVFPISYSASVTWGQIVAFTWAAVGSNTWGKPLDIAINVNTAFSTANVAENRMFIKFLKALRFRQVNFRLTGTTDGSSTQGPFRVYGLVAFTYIKENVSKQVS